MYPTKVLAAGNELMIDGEKGKFEPIRYANFIEYIAQVMLYGLLTDGVLAGDLSIGETRYDCFDDIQLAGS